MLTDLATKLARSVKPLDDIAAGCEAILLAVVVRLATWGAIAAAVRSRRIGR